MKLNVDCMRDIMLEAEKQPYDEELTFHALKEALPNYSEDELTYTCIKLNEAELIKALIINADNLTIVQFISDITYEGHQFLSNIHENKIWTGVKAIAERIGSTSLEAITQIASNVITELIKAQFGLTGPIS